MSGLSAALPSIGRAMQPRPETPHSITSRDELLEDRQSESDTSEEVQEQNTSLPLDSANSQRSLNDNNPKNKVNHTGKGNGCDCCIQKWVAGRLHITKTHCLLIIIVLVFLGIVTFLTVALRNQWNCDLARPAHCEPPCPRLWIGYEGVCYFFSKEKRNWTSSQNFCISYSASLARIHNEEKDFLMHLKGKDIYWIGLQKAQDRTWRWTDGENATLEVTGDGGDCAYLNNDAEASSSGCRKELPWICRKSAASK